MGLSTSKTTQDTTQHSTAMPITPAYVSPAAQGYYGAVSSLGSQIAANPSMFATPANDLQVKAGAAAGNLGSWKPTLTQSTSLANTAAGTQFAPVNTSLANATQAALPTAPTTDMAGYQAVSPVSLGSAPQAGYQTVSPVSLGAAPQASLTEAQAAQLGPAAQAAAASGLTNLQAYQNPYQQQVVDTTLASNDLKAAQDRAALMAQGAKAQAFGGSRFGIAQGQLASDQELNRAQTEAQLRAQGFNTAAGLSQNDAALQQQANLANQGAQNQFALAQGQFGQEAGLANANAANANSQFNAGLAGQYGIAGANLAQQANLANMGAANENSQYNTGLAANYGLAGAQFGQQANLANQGAANENAQFNASQRNALLSQIFGTQAANNQFNAGQANQTSLANAAARNQMGQFNTGLQEQQVANQLAAAGQIGQNASLAGNLAQGDVASQMNAGNSLYQVQAAQNLAPLLAMQGYSGLMDPALIAALSGQTVDSTGHNVTVAPNGLLNSLIGAGAQLGSAAIMASDRRVKREIEHLGDMPDGLGVYSFRYVWDAPNDEPLLGVMADEVARLRPWALGPEIAGYATVDYSKLEAA